MRPACLAIGSMLVLTVSACTSGGGPATGRTGSTSASGPLSSAAPPAPMSTPASPSAAPTAARSSSSTPAPGTTTRPAPPTKSPVPRGGPHRPLVVLNPGHNGGNASHPAAINRPVPAGYGEYKACDTTGTNTDAGYPEHAFNWDIALRVRTILRAHSVRVVLTRPDDSGVGPCVDERAAIGNAGNVDAVVSIHADGAPAAGHGFHVNQDSRRPDGASAAVVARSMALGRALHGALQGSSGLVPSTYIGTNGYYYRSDLAGLNLATRPATFLELGNMRNAGDSALQSTPAGRARIAAAVAAGILAFLGR